MFGNVRFFWVGGWRKGKKPVYRSKERINVGAWLAGWLALPVIIVLLRSPSCKLSLARSSAKLKISRWNECSNNKLIFVHVKMLESEFCHN